MAEKTALVVDDSRSSRYAMRKFLERAGYAVDTAESAQDAYVYLQRRHPQVIFLDHQMPGSDGLDVLRVLKEHSESADIPVVLCSAKDDDDFLRVAREAGAAAVLPKPPEPQQLSALLRELAGGSSKPRSKSSAAPTRTAPSLGLPIRRPSTDDTNHSRTANLYGAPPSNKPMAPSRVAPSFDHGPAAAPEKHDDNVAAELAELRREINRLQTELTELRQSALSSSQAPGATPELIKALETPMREQARRAIAEILQHSVDGVLQEMREDDGTS